MRGLNLALAFLLELMLLAAIAYWGLQLDRSSAVRWLVAIVAPVALAGVWSQIAAPRARRHLAPAPLVAFKLVVFTIGAALLYGTGEHTLALALEAVAVVNLALATAWKQA